MSVRTLRNAVAAVALTAAAAAATGCGSGDDPPAGHRSAPTGASTELPSPTAGGRAATPEAERVGTDGKGPTVPKAELTPATGSFTEKQREYLVDRVPRGTDPAAVLEAGQSVCDRIGRTAKVDRDAAVSALKSGEIADAEAAVTHLCPKHEPLLEAAGLTSG